LTPALRRSVLLIALLAPWAAAAEEPTPDPWTVLDRLRLELAADSPLRADFVQTYTPAGFSSGDSESGRLAAALPDCLRWDYVEPYGKSFLVCGSRAWSWVDGEPRGQRVTIEARNEAGLDLLLLRADELAQRYLARVSRQRDGGLELALEPLDEDSALAAANLSVAVSGNRITALDYRDRDGNVTSFRFTNWMPLEAEGSFEPPTGIEWAEP